MLEVILNEIRIKTPEKRLLLSGIRFSVESEQVITIAGKNGSGKSTLLKCIPGLLDPGFYEVKGQILYNGSDILLMDQKTVQQLRRNDIKYIMQDSAGSFDPLKKFEYYFEQTFKGNNAEIKEAEDLLKFFLLPDANKLFKLHSYEISGGMAQRISLILALLAHPKILLLDEPSSGIDSPVTNLLLLKIKEYVLSEQASVIMVTHDLRLAEKVSDKIAILSDGKLSSFYTSENFISPGNTLLNEIFGEGINEYLT